MNNPNITSRHFAPFHYCPRCAQPALHTPHEKLLTCHNCHFHYYTNAAAAVMALILNPEGHILLVRRNREPARGTLDLPGGFVDPQETIENALLREVKEETGLHIAHFTFLASFPNHYHYRNITYHTIDLAFLCQPENPHNLTESDETTAPAYYPPHTIQPQHLSFDSVRNAINTYLQTLRKNQT